MNLFLLHRKLRKAARYHNNKHVVKMVLETTQILYTSHYILNKSQNWQDKFKLKIYRKTHVNHPICKWLIESVYNYKFTLKLGFLLCKEYKFRYNRTHKCYNHLKELSKNYPEYNISDKKITKMPICMPDIYKQNDPVLSYRNYYNNEKISFCVYKNREKPYWLNN